MRSPGPPGGVISSVLTQARLVRVQVVRRCRRWRPSRAGIRGWAAVCGSGSRRRRSARLRAAARRGAIPCPATTASRKPAYWRGHGRPVALARHVVPGALAQRARDFGTRHQQVQILEDQVLFAGADRHLQADIVGELLKGADIGDHHRLAQAERAQQRAGALAHGGIAQVEHDVAGAQVADEILDRREAEHAHAGREAHGADHRLHRELRDAARPPESSWRWAPGAPGGGRRAAIRRCACTA